MTQKQKEDFTHNVNASGAELQAAKQYIKDLMAWKSDNEVHDKLKDNTLNYLEALVKGNEAYLKSYQAAEKGNITQAEKAIVEYRKIEKTFNDYYNNGKKIKKQAGMNLGSQNPWEDKLGSLADKIKSTHSTL